MLYYFSLLRKVSYNDNYVKQANKSGLPVDLFKKRLDDIQLYNMPKLHYGDKIGAKKYYFQDWFGIKNIKYIDSRYEPLFNEFENIKNDFIYRLNNIGILNNYIYKNNSIHFLLINESFEQITVNSTQIGFVIRDKSIFDRTMIANIQIKNINSINTKYVKKFNKVIDVYKHVKKEFCDYIMFGSDVQAGIKTIRDSAGPPDRIYSYLEALKDFCIYKRANKSIFSDDYILQSLGCICSYENKEVFNDEKAKIERTFDNGNNERELFDLHLKPNTFTVAEEQEKKERTVRIYISWSDLQKKIIVGWIGKHPYNPLNKS